MLSTPRNATSAGSFLLWVVTCALSVLLASLASACESRPKPQRDWRPDDHVQPAELDPSRMPPDMQAGQPQAAEVGGIDRAAEALWNVSCAGCHGREGNGQGPGRPPGAQPPDFTSPDFQKSRNDAQLTAAIVEGRNMMPPFGKQVNEQGVHALVAYIRKLGAPAAAAPAAVPAPATAPAP